jgi:GNAT superfamily N-acetyltransferase
LSAIAHAAKAVWGYPESWLRRWSEVLTVTPEYVRSVPTHGLVEDCRIVGYFSLALRDAAIHLEQMGVLPDAMGRGGGRPLFEFAAELARASGAKKLRVKNDPHWEGFYVHMGVTLRGQVASPMDGVDRFLPLLEMPL